MVRIRLLDMGQRLGRFIGQYRNAYFKPDKQNGYLVYSYKPLPDAERQIYEKIADIAVSMKAIDHLHMPELLPTNIPCSCPTRSKKLTSGSSPN